MGSGLTPSGCQDCAFTQPQPLATVIKKPARLLFPITPHHIPAKCFRLCEQHRLGTSSGQPPLALPPLSEQSHAPEPCWGTTRGCLSPQALSCVTHHTGPAPSLSPCAAVVPTRSPGFRHCCDWAPNHQSCRSSWGKCCWRGHLGQLSPRTFCSIPAGRWRAGTQPTRCHHPPPPGAHLANRCWPKCWLELGTKALATSSRRGRASTAESSQIYVLPGCDDPGEAPGDWEEVPSPPAWHDSQHSTPMACPWLSPSNIPSIPDSAC